MKRLFLIIISVAFCGFCTADLALAQTECSAADFGAVVDQTARALRDLNISGSKRFKAKLDSVRQKHSLSEQEIQQRAAAVRDEKIDEFNKEIDVFVSRMDALSQTPNEQIDCAKLDELKRIRDQLLTAMGQKSGYMLARIDIELAKPPETPKNAATLSNRAGKGDLAEVRPDRQQTAARTEPPRPAQQGRDPSPAAPVTSAAIPDLPQKRPGNIPGDTIRTARAPSDTINGFSPQGGDARRGDTDTQRPSGFRTETAATTAADGAYAPPPDEQPLAPPTRLASPPDGSLAPPPDGYQQLPPPGEAPGDSYSIAEIREAGRGIFGTITAEFAGAINYAFQQFGQPNAYIVGGEGGGAILAGLRYGNGTLHQKGAPPSAIYWQGPSLGYDLGAEGSRALFLVYNLEDPNAIYGRFTGIGGSAYVAGGIGLNILGKGGMVMVPIRSGIGLRLGANVAYLKFTDRQTWNPF